MRLTNEDMKKLIKHRNGTKLISFEELKTLELDEEYDKLDVLYSKAELLGDLNRIGVDEGWIIDNVNNGSTLDEMLKSIEEAKRKIHNIMVAERNEKIDTIINEDNGKSGHID